MAVLINGGGGGGGASGIYIRGVALAGFQIDGALAIGSNLAPLVSIPTDQPVGSGIFRVKEAPDGDDLVIVLKLNGVAWLTLTIADGTTSVAPTPAALVAAGPLTADGLITLDITSVGTTFPGADLSGLLFR